MKIYMIALIAASALLVGCTESSVERASQEFNQLPAAVQKVVRDTAPNAEIADVETKTRDGMTVYEIQFRDRDRYPAMAVAADGRLMRYEAGTAAMGRPDAVEGTAKGSSRPFADLSALPESVQKAVKDKAPRAEVVDIRRKEENGRMIYEIEYAGKERKPMLRIAQDGTILKLPDEPEAKR